MNIRELLLVGVLAVTAVYAAWMKSSANRLRTDLAALQATHQRLEENHSKMKESYIQFVTKPGTRDEAFRKVVAILEADGATDIIGPSGPSTTRINDAAGITIK